MLSTRIENDDARQLESRATTEAREYIKTNNYQTSPTTLQEHLHAPIHRVKNGSGSS